MKKPRKLFKDNKVDILPSYSKTLENIGLLSQFIKYPIVIVTDNRYKYISSLNELDGKQYLPKIL